MSDDGIKNKSLDLIAYFVEKILDIVTKISNQEQQPDTTDMPELEDQTSAAQKQKGQGLEILTPGQMITRLPYFISRIKSR